MTELADDEQWRQRFRQKLGINDIEIRLDALERRALRPLPEHPSEWYLRRPMLAAVAGVTGLMTWGAIWFYAMYSLAKWLSH